MYIYNPFKSIVTFLIEIEPGFVLAFALSIYINALLD